MASISELIKKAQEIIDPTLLPESGSDPHTHQPPSYPELNVILRRFGAQPVLDARGNIQGLKLMIPLEMIPIRSFGYKGSLKALFDREFGEPIDIKEGLGPGAVSALFGPDWNKAYFPTRAFAFSDRDPFGTYARHVYRRYKPPPPFDFGVVPRWYSLSTPLSHSRFTPFATYAYSPIFLPQRLTTYDKRDLLKRLGNLLAKRQAHYLMEVMAPDRAMVSLGSVQPKDPLFKAMQGFTMKEHPRLPAQVWIDKEIRPHVAGWTGTMVHEGAHTYFPSMEWLGHGGQRTAQNLMIPVNEGLATLYERSYFFHLLREIADDETVDPEIRKAAREIYETSMVPLPTGHVISGRALDEIFSYLFRGEDETIDPARRFQEVFTKRYKDMVPAALSFFYPMILERPYEKVAKQYLDAIEYFDKRNPRLANMLKHNYMYVLDYLIEAKLSDLEFASPEEAAKLKEELDEILRTHPVFVPSKTIDLEQARKELGRDTVYNLAPFFQTYYRVDDPALKLAYIKHMSKSWRRSQVFPGLDSLPEDLRKSILNHAVRD